MALQFHTVICEGIYVCESESPNGTDGVPILKVLPLGENRFGIGVGRIGAIGVAFSMKTDFERLFQIQKDMHGRISADGGFLDDDLGISTLQMFLEAGEVVGDCLTFRCDQEVGLITTEPVVVEGEGLEMEMGVNALRGFIRESGAA